MDKAVSLANERLTSLRSDSLRKRITDCHQITGHNLPTTQRAAGGWMSSTDARSRIILHMNRKGQHLPILCYGLQRRTISSSEDDTTELMPKEKQQPPSEDIIPISPLAKILRGAYRTPTYMMRIRAALLAYPKPSSDWVVAFNPTRWLSANVNVTITAVCACQDPTREGSHGAHFRP